MVEQESFQYELDSDRLEQVLPNRSGVYLFKERSGRTVYVGKAKRLRARVLSYFKGQDRLPQKTRLMLKRASGLEVILTRTDKEAFILEDSLVKKLMPRYNVILRDDKRYPCLRLDIRQEYPALTIARRIKKDGALYFGPFSSANAVRSTLKVIERVFQLRKCKGNAPPKRERPCLNGQMGRCLGPCAREVSVADYHQIVQQIRLFLEGRNHELIDRLEADMAKASSNLEYEKAARIRDQIRAIEKTVERQHVVSPRMENLDVIGMAADGPWCQVVILFVRNGSVVGSRNFLLKNPIGRTGEALESFLKQFYARESFIPGQILVPEPVEDSAAITNWLGDIAGKRVTIRRPQRGEKVRLVRMARENAENLLQGRAAEETRDLTAAVRSALNLDRNPRLIEGLDISNLYGKEAVGSIVSFVDGLPNRAGYRNYRIKATEGIDDYGMMTELVGRRMKKPDPPDLFLVDGGKGQLSAVKRALEEYMDKEGEPAAGEPEVIAIAKPDETRGEKQDKLYTRFRKNPIRLSDDDPVLLLMMRIRDEAHRRAVTYHRKLRGSGLSASRLDQVPGIGPRRKRALLKHFPDTEALAEATAEELTRVPGISFSLAEQILSRLRAANAEETRLTSNS